jgi:hypothetical protein
MIFASIWGIKNMMGLLPLERFGGDLYGGVGRLFAQSD